MSYSVLSESGPTSGGGGAFGECGHNLFKARLLDHGDRSARFDPLCRPLMGLGPHMALPLHQKRIDFDFAHRRVACFIAQFVVSEDAYGLGANSPRDPSFFEGFARR